MLLCGWLCPLVLSAMGGARWCCGGRAVGGGCLRVVLAAVFVKVCVIFVFVCVCYPDNVTVVHLLADGEG